MNQLPQSLATHRVRATDQAAVIEGVVRWSPGKSIWFIGMTLVAVCGGVLLFTWNAFALFVISTGVVLLFGHSLGSHRKLIHDSFQCPRWLERVLVYLGVQVGLAGPLGLLRQHELRDYAQRLPDCHPYLRHGNGPCLDAWWQLNCDLQLFNAPDIQLEPRIANDLFYRFLERTWMWQQLPVALLFYLWGGWSFVVFGVCARVSAGVFGHWLIGYFAHNHGEMHHEVRGAAVQGRNIRWTSLLTMGESWHNNHHAFPGSARLGLHPGEWDPGWWVLTALQRLGLVWALRLPAHLEPRPELVRLDAMPASSNLHLRRLLKLLCSSGAADDIEVVWPGRRVGSASLRWMLSMTTRTTLEPSSSRLLLRSGGQELLVGVPALCAAIAHHRGAWVRALMLLCAPLAAGFECARDCYRPTAV
jgi:stearoyl-CoA desaturase (delta-9 desaturase)